MLSTETKLSSYQGVVTLGLRDAVTGAVAKLFDIGNVPELQVDMKTTVETIKESTTGQRLEMKRLENGKEANLTMKLHNFDKRTQQILLRGETQQVLGGTVTDEAAAIGLAAGDIIKLAHEFVTNLVIEDSATPAVVVDAPPAGSNVGTKYQVDPDAGLVRFIDVTGYTQPFKSSYSYAAAEVTALFTTGQLEYVLYFSGVNTADMNKPIVMELYRTAFDPADNLPIIGDKAAVYTLKGSMLADTTKDGSDPELGYFGRIKSKA